MGQTPGSQILTPEVNLPEQGVRYVPKGRYCAYSTEDKRDVLIDKPDPWNELIVIIARVLEERRWFEKTVPFEAFYRMVSYVQEDGKVVKIDLAAEAVSEWRERAVCTEAEATLGDVTKTLTEVLKLVAGESEASIEVFGEGVLVAFKKRKGNGTAVVEIHLRLPLSEVMARWEK
jgi:hypothetical protein